MERFNPKKFVETQIGEIRKAIGNEKALVAVSGGVDSTTCAVLTRKAVGETLVCIILDDAFMREGEPEKVAEILSKEPFNVPVKIVDVRERFLNAMKGLRDAEEKRKKFRETFYNVLSETAKKENCRILVQGTIRADIVETVGGVKTQHNVLEQVGINPMEKFGFKVVEPLLMLYKEQVRMVARHLGLPSEVSERQPFPGPGLSVRVVGEIRLDKLDTVKKATTIVENALAEHKPSQYFAAVMDNEEAPWESSINHVRETAARFLNVPSRNTHVKVFKDKATGVKGGERRYGKVIGIKIENAEGGIYKAGVQKLVSLQTKITSENLTITRVLYTIKEAPEKRPYVISIRAVQTTDFLTAQVAEIPWKTLEKAASEILENCPKVSAVYYDVTPKPPATIEME
ncbi:MAG: GMP synthase (glutamine-hydrolyzing) [Candidatus Bathycorpusculaceae bacterium]